MSLVLPTDVEGASTSHALGRAAIWVSGVFLLSTFILVFALKLVLPQVSVALALVGLGLAGIGVGWALVTRNRALVLTLMLVAAGGLYLYSFEIAVQSGPGRFASDSVLLSMPKIAMTVVGVAGRTLASSIVRCSLGFVLASVAVQVGGHVGGMRFAIDFPSIATFVGLIVLLLGLAAGRRQAKRGSDTMRFAALAEERSIERSRIATRARAALHDTVLNDLHALTLSDVGTLTDAHRAFLARDIASLTHPALLLNEATLRARAGGDAVLSSGLGPVIRSARQRGLVVEISGDPQILAQLEPGVVSEVVKAVDQALVNVSKHANVNEAEVAIVAGVDTVNVVVTDAGAGFDASAVDAQRMGLRVSISQRVESVGGTVRVWSTPGSGTAVLLSVPLATPGAVT